MIGASLPEGEDLVDVLLSKEADVNAKSKFLSPCHLFSKLLRRIEGYRILLLTILFF